MVVIVITVELHEGTALMLVVGGVGGGAKENHPPFHPCPTVFPFSLQTTVRVPEGATIVGNGFPGLTAVKGPPINGARVFMPL